jgi:hypothetical protein
MKKVTVFFLVLVLLLVTVMPALASGGPPFPPGYCARNVDGVWGGACASAVAAGNLQAGAVGLCHAFGQTGNCVSRAARFLH